ncbi:MAG: hypothetical protein BRD49_04590 [Bacteroidetes bacterium SW_10_40_5]|nr:MAG: hypothetical protein BRD49_04590 [Bacteroidetes bacterium SW_10_40_5]
MDENLNEKNESQENSEKVNYNSPTVDEDHEEKAAVHESSVGEPIDDEVMEGQQEQPLASFEQEEEQDSQEDLQAEPSIPDYSTYGKQALFDEMKILAQTDQPLGDNKCVQEVKKYFEIFLENEHRVALKKFLEDGNDEMDFAPAPDPMKSKFFQHLKTFKQKRAQQIEALNKEKEENLRIKKEILDQLKAITEDVEAPKKFKEFNELRDRWKNTGYVPKIEVENIQRAYRFYVNKFFDNLELYSEFKQLDRKKNLQSKQGICEKLEQLKSSNGKAGPVPQEEHEEIVNRFNTAMSNVIAKQEELQEAINQEQQKNLEAKQKIVEQIKEFENFDADHPKDWVAKNKELEELISQWKQIGFVPMNKKTEITQQFQDSVRSFNRRKNSFFKDKKKERNENLEKKRNLIEQARALLEPDDYIQAKETIIDLQKQWKSIGAVPPNHSEAIWKEFRSICDKFFEQLANYYSQKEKEEQENLEAKQALCKRIEDLVNKNIEDPESQVKTVQQEWESIGFVPYNQKEKIRKRFDKALKNILNKAKSKLDVSPELMNYKIKTDGWKEQNNEGAIETEKKKLNRQYKDNEQEIDTLEGNLGLFNNSEGAKELTKEYRNKIDELKAQNEFIKEKLAILKE